MGKGELARRLDELPVSRRERPRASGCYVGPASIDMSEAEIIIMLDVVNKRSDRREDVVCIVFYVAN